MKLIHVSDIHLTIPGEEMGGLDPHARFDLALTHIARNHSDAARIIITGDLTHWGEREAYVALRQALDAQPLPVRLMIGNHDARDTFCDVFDGHPQDANGYINHFEDLAGERLIYLDSVNPRTHAGHFGTDRLDWLIATLADCKRARIFMHHNPFSLGLPAEDKIALVAADQPGFHDVLQKNANKIAHLHFGHVHATISGSFAGIPFTCVPSTGNQSIPDMTEPELLKGGPLPPAYNVLLIDGENTIIHQIPFAWDGPVASAGTDWEDWAKPDVAAQ